MTDQKKRQWILLMAAAGVSLVALGFLYVMVVCPRNDGMCTAVREASAKSPPWTPITSVLAAPSLLLTWWWRTVQKDKDIAQSVAQLQHGELLPSDEAKLDGWRQATDVQAAFTVIGRLPKSERPLDLRCARLDRIEGIDSDLVAAELRGASLRRAVLIHANLSSAYLRDADLCDANLRHADLTGACLDGAKFTHARFTVGEKCTTFPVGFDPFAKGMTLVDDQGVPVRETHQRAPSDCEALLSIESAPS